MRDWRLSRAEAVILACLSAWSLVLLVAMLARAHSDGLVFLGGDSRLPADQLQYLALIRDGGRHLLASARLDPGTTVTYFLHPMWTVSGLGRKLGMSLQLAVLIWKPVAVAVLFAGVVAYVRTMLPSPRARAVALLVALFFYTPVQAVIYATHLGGDRAHREIGVIATEVLPAASLWGYLPAAIAIGLMPLFLIGTERILEPARRAPGRGSAWYAGWTALAGLLASWLHPWQGETLLVILAGLAVWGRLGREHLRLAVPAAATLAPLVYYLVLSRTDTGYRVVESQSDQGRFSLPLLAIALAPLAVPALAGLRRPAGTAERALLLWVPAAIACYLVLSPTSRAHALEGVSIPLAVLAVRGAARYLSATPRNLAPLIAAAGVLFLTASAIPFAVRSWRKVRNPSLPSAYVAHGDRRALAYLSRAPGSGGVLAGSIGAAVPPYSGRTAWIGQPAWTPKLAVRGPLAYRLFTGSLPPPAVRRLVTSTGARFVFAPCGTRADLRPALTPLGFAARAFGCSTVYERPRPGG